MILNRCLLALAGLVLSHGLHAQLPQPASTTEGLLRGVAAESNSAITVFRGIPYAAPPIAENRWREPQPVSPWAGVRLADRNGPRCIQRNFAVAADQPLTSEDCLYLNVWTPATQTDAKLPVMVWIHGGAFQAGSGGDANYDGTNLAALGSVVVTLNYRLGAFGFLAHPALSAESPHHSSGNYALLDMVAALQWVQRNIAAFGGDPQRVTIVGESAGAQSVAVLVASPVTTGLFQRAVVQSGGWMGLSINRLPTLAQREQQGLALAAKLGAETLDAMRHASTQEVYDNFTNVGGISVDGYLLPRDPSLIFAAGEQQPVDVLAGSNSNEALFFGPGLQSVAELQAHVSGKFGALSNAFDALYPATSDTQANQSYLKAYSAELAWQVRRLAQYQRERGKQAYAYFFSHVPPGQEARGATHVAELVYMFNQHALNPAWDANDRELGNQMSQYWINFVKTGNPNGTGLPVWPAYRSGAPGEVMSLAETAAAESDPIPTTAELQFFERAYRSLPAP